MVCEIGRKLANGSHPEGGNEWVLLRWAACHEWGPQGSILVPTLFNTFINCLDDEIESTFTKFSDGTRLGGEVITSER